MLPILHYKLYFWRYEALKNGSCVFGHPVFEKRQNIRLEMLRRLKNLFCKRSFITAGISLIVKFFGDLNEDSLKFMKLQITMKVACTS